MKITNKHKLEPAEGMAFPKYRKIQVILLYSRKPKNRVTLIQSMTGWEAPSAKMKTYQAHKILITQ